MKSIGLRRRIPVAAMLVVVTAATYSHLLQSFDRWCSQWILSAVTARQIHSPVTVLTVPSDNPIAYRQWLVQLLPQLKQKKIKAVGLVGPVMRRALSRRLQRRVDELSAKNPQSVAFRVLLDELMIDAKLVKQFDLLPVVIGVPVNDGDGDGLSVVDRDGLVNAQVPAQQVFPDYLKPFFEVPEVKTSLPWVAEALLGQHKAGLLLREPSLQIRLLQQLDGRFHGAFALQLAAAASGTQARYIEGRGLRLNGHWYQVSADHRLVVWPFDVPVLDAAAGLDSLKAQTVVIAPVSRQAQASRHAAFTAALLTGKISHVPYWYHALQRLVLVVLIILLLWMPVARLPWMITVVLASACMVSVAMAMVWMQNLWLPMSVPVLVLWLGSLLIGLQQWLALRWQKVYDDAVISRHKLAKIAMQAQDVDEAWQQLKPYVADTRVVETIQNIAGWYEQKADLYKAAKVYQHLRHNHPRVEGIQSAWQRTRHALSPENAESGQDATMVLPAQTAVMPVSLGRYRIEQEIGKGAFGRVFLGVDPKIGRKVAVKTLDPGADVSEGLFHENMDRFLREAEAAGKLNHPNIVTIYDVGEQDNIPYIAMDYIEGESLEVFLAAEQRLPVKQILMIARQVAEALDYAHSQKVVHRDIKPANIIYNPFTHLVKITDFGVACMTDHRKTHSGIILGSPSYMSPEQVTGQAVDGRSDLFSLSVTTFQLLCGELPYEGESIAALMYNIAHARPRSLRRLGPELPLIVTRVLVKGMQKNPDKRYKSGHAMAEAFGRCLDQL